MSGRVITAHRLVEDFIAIDIVGLEKEGRLSPGHDLIAPAGTRLEFILLVVNSSGNEIELGLSSGTRERVTIARTPCHFGGTRPWFACPSPNCGRRCRKLYLQVNDRWLCRTCADARYRSQRQSIQARRLARARELRERLGGPNRPVDPLPDKPPHMHWDTYDRLARRIKSLETEGIMLAVRRTDRDLERLEQRVAILSRRL